MKVVGGKMGVTTSQLVQSKFFLPVFNMAIFDGPFRLYFAHEQEAEALRLYFELHEALGEKERSDRSRTLFVLLYPNESSYQNAFATSEPATVARMGESQVVGLRGPEWDPTIIPTILQSLDELKAENSLEAEPVIELSL